MKLVVAAIYTNFESAVVDDEGMEQMDAGIAAPVGDRLVLRFRHLPRG